MPNWFNWQFMQWYRSVPRWDADVWLLIIFVGAYWEIMGAIYNDRTTFTGLVRHTTPVWLRVVILIILIWHFCIAKANFE